MCAFLIIVIHSIIIHHVIVVDVVVDVVNRSSRGLVSLSLLLSVMRSLTASVCVYDEQRRLYDVCGAGLGWMMKDTMGSSSQHANSNSLTCLDDKGI